MKKPTFTFADEPVHHKQHSSAPAALVLITIGILLLLNNLNILSWTVWLSLWKLWPLAIIILGLHILFGDTRVGKLSAWFITSLLLLAAVAFITLDLTGGLRHFSKSPFNHLAPLVAHEMQEQITIAEQQYPDITLRTLIMHTEGVDFSIQENSTTDIVQLFATYTGAQFKPIVTQEVHDDVLTVDVGQGESTRGFSFGSFGKGLYNVTLGKSNLLTTLDIELGSGHGTITTSQTKINKITAGIGSGSLTANVGSVSIPQNGIDAAVGSGSLVIQVPPKVGVTLAFSVGGGSMSLNGKQLAGVGEIQSDNYNQAQVKMPVEIEVGSGRVVITTQ